LRGAAARQRVERLAVQEHASPADRDDAGEDLEERRLPGAVLAEDRRDRARGDRGVQPAQDRRPSGAGDGPAGLEPVGLAHGVLRSSHANTGAPSAAVSAPIGSSAGAIAARATASAATTRVAPTRNDAGRSVRWSLPNAARTAWGTRSPTKPITPANATATPVRSDDARKTTRLVRSVSTPRAAAFSSPTLNRLSRAAEATSTAAPASA